MSTCILRQQQIISSCLVFISSAGGREEGGPRLKFLARTLLSSIIIKLRHSELRVVVISSTRASYHHQIGAFIACQSLFKQCSLLRQSCKDGSTRSQDQTIEKAWVGFPFFFTHKRLCGGWAPTAQLDPETSGF